MVPRGSRGLRETESAELDRSLFLLLLLATLLCFVFVKLLPTVFLLPVPLGLLDLDRVTVGILSLGYFIPDKFIVIGFDKKDEKNEDGWSNNELLYVWFVMMFK